MTTAIDKRGHTRLLCIKTMQFVDNSLAHAYLLPNLYESLAPVVFIGCKSEPRNLANSRTWPTNLWKGLEKQPSKFSEMDDNRRINRSIWMIEHRGVIEMSPITNLDDTEARREDRLVRIRSKLREHESTSYFTISPSSTAQGQAQITCGFKVSDHSL